MLHILLSLQIKEENPRLARDSKVLRVTMDNVYEVFTTPRETTGLQGIHFRFMPDMQQVKHALQLYKEAGVPTKSFVGVPVFQAEGLTVTTQDMVRKDGCCYQLNKLRHLMSAELCVGGSTAAAMSGSVAAQQLH